MSQVISQGAYTCQAGLEISVSGRDGTVILVIEATASDRVGDRVRFLVYQGRMTKAQARLMAQQLRQLVHGDIGDFSADGLSCSAGEYSGVEIGLPHGRAVWLAEDVDGLALAEGLEKEAGE